MHTILAYLAHLQHAPRLARPPSLPSTLRVTLPWGSGVATGGESIAWHAGCFYLPLEPKEGPEVPGCCCFWSASSTLATMVSTVEGGSAGVSCRSMTGSSVVREVELLHLTQIPTLENRRIYLKLCTVFKIIHGLFSFTPDVFMPQPSRHDYNYNLPLLYQPYAHTNAFQSSFVPSTISIWNHLPHDALIAPSLRTFKLNVAPMFL